MDALDAPTSPLAATISDNERMLLKRGLTYQPPPPGYISPDYSDEDEDRRDQPGEPDDSMLLQLPLECCCRYVNCRCRFCSANGRSGLLFKSENRFLVVSQRALTAAAAAAVPLALPRLASIVSPSFVLISDIC